MRILPILLSLSLSLGLTACDTVLPEDTVCEPASSTSCVGSNECSGRRTCDDEGGGFSQCRCEDAGMEPARPSLGAECMGNSQCPQGAFCLTPDATDFFGGGPPVGVCAAACSGGRCDDFDQAFCVDVGGGSSLCLEGCSRGTRDGERCHGRTDTACEATASETLGFCRPLCSRDADCPSGHCDPATGACTATGTPGESDFGQQCSDAGDGDSLPCSGLCVNVSNQFEACSHRCVFGQSADCSLLEGVRGGCLIASPRGSIGDVGYCAPLCNEDAECQAFGKNCEAFGDPVLESAFSSRGACTDGGG